MGFWGKVGHEDQELFKISKDETFLIKRVMTSNKFIIKTYSEGVKLLTINDLKTISNELFVKDFISS